MDILHISQPGPERNYREAFPKHEDNPPNLHNAENVSYKAKGASLVSVQYQQHKAKLNHLHLETLKYCSTLTEGKTIENHHVKRCSVGTEPKIAREKIYRNV